MPRRRSTVPLTHIVRVANRMIEHAPTAAERLALAIFLETLLHDANAYAGFQLARSEFLPADEQTDDTVLRPDSDDSRRVYFLPRA